MTAGEQIIPASELASAIKQIKELQRFFGKKQWKIKLLKKLSSMVEKKWIALSPLLPKDGK